jgi:hypothetical protein
MTDLSMFASCFDFPVLLVLLERFTTKARRHVF